MGVPQLDLIGIVVEDMARSLAFYRQLGLDLPSDYDTQPHVEITLAGGLRLAWDTVETVHSFDSGYVHRSDASGMGLAFLLENAAEVDALYDKVTSAGYEGHRAPWDAVWGQRYALLNDPDGNGVDLFAPLP